MKQAWFWTDLRTVCESFAGPAAERGVDRLVGRLREHVESRKWHRLADTISLVYNEVGPRYCHG